MTSSELLTALRAALETLNLDVPAAALDRAAVAALVELEMASKLPRLVTVSGAEWVTVKARADAGSVTVGSLARGVQVLAGVVEGDWRPIYGQPLGWVKSNLVV